MHSLPACPCCVPRSGLSRRQFLCTTAAAAVAAPAMASVIGAGEAQAAPSRAGRPILLKGGCVLSLDKAVGDFEQADVLIEGSKISAVKPNISAPNAQVIDAVELDRDAGLRRYPPAHVAGLPAQRAAGRLARGLLATSCSASSAPT